jgi:hypothetical protein
MRTRTADITLLALAAVALGAPAAAHAGSLPPAFVHVTDCQTGSKGAHRRATYHARMRAVPGTARMAMRFQLRERFAGHGAQALSAPALKKWRRSRPGVARFGYSQTVKNLAPGGSYRMVVRYRWYDDSGHVILRARRVSGACVENGSLPNLVVSAVKVAPGSTPGTAGYSVSIGNVGKGPAENFSVALILDGALADSRTVERLEAGETATIDMNGPVCHRLRAVVDSEDTVPETIEDDNGLGARC